MIELGSETRDDRWAVEALFDLCFAPGREALSSYRLRDETDPVSELCLVARDDGDTIAGAIRFWPVRVAAQPALLLGPVAVHPTHQGEGLGAALIQGGLEAARDRGWTRVILVGDAPYYSRFGFHRIEDVIMPPPTNPNRVLGAELVPGAWQGLAGVVTRWD
ncbi:GNAT family N-acetyltransferase [Falsiphaeobacter marinintestinus]|uniref:GNAT family N-acetyltransferase n=1 Tax=Falsiphaeobacter marinintestinus TaxID=1492905 RepID=UPI0011B5A7F7|nr:N-acetyltransferase [Phaeobacter marinintestinus]